MGKYEHYYSNTCLLKCINKRRYLKDSYTMITSWLLIHFLVSKMAIGQLTELEKEHNPELLKTTRVPELMSGEKLPSPSYETPDFREPEPLYLPRGYYWEDHRPYRLSPHYKTAYRWQSAVKDENIYYAGCYCTTVYKRFTLLAGCAVITTRHILTTASSTWLILRDRINYQTLENILGVWYDTNHNTFNSSMYLTPARIHFHPWFHKPEHVNRSHPFPFTFDLAVWALTHNVFGWYMSASSTIVCLRATSNPSEQGSPAPTKELFIIVGYQYIWAYKRKPMPWFKYGFRTRHYTSPCPKTEWGWFICIYSEFLKYGIDSGAALHRAFKGWSYRYDGLVGLGAFSMKLRSVELNHYFTVLDCHVVLDFLYDAYFSYQKYVWLDARFHDTKGAAPRAKYYIPHEYVMGEEHYVRYLPI